MAKLTDKQMSDLMEEIRADGQLQLGSFPEPLDDRACLELTRKGIEDIMELQAQAHFQMNAYNAIRAIRAGAVPNNLAASNLLMLDALLYYGKPR
jgi:hypothetical protein